MELRDDTGSFWRNIDLECHDGCVEAAVADNVHHFTVTVLHDQSRVTSVSANALRVPWVTCPGATALLTDLVGTPLGEGARVSLDQSQHCTHLLDLAQLAIAQASRGGTRRYECGIAHDPIRDVVVAALRRDGDLVIEWHLRDGRVTSPGPFQGHLTTGRSEWSDAVLADPDLREGGLILRRAVFIYRSRQFSRPRTRAADILALEGVCFSFQPLRADSAVRPVDFQELP